MGVQVVQVAEACALWWWQLFNCVTSRGESGEGRVGGCEQRTDGRYTRDARIVAWGEAETPTHNVRRTTRTSS